MPPRLLLHGHDTIECAYYLRRIGKSALDFSRLSAMKEEMRNSKSRDPVPLQLGDIEFQLLPYGTKSGYPFVIQNQDFSIQCGEFNTPSFFVTFRSLGLWQHGAVGLHRRFMAWAESVRPAPLGETDAAMEVGRGLVDEAFRVLKAAAEAEGFEVCMGGSQVVF